MAGVAAALRAVDDLQVDGGLPETTAVALRDALAKRADRYRARITMLEESDDGDATWTPEFEASVQARHAVIDAQRDELLRWRDSGRLPDAAFANCSANSIMRNTRCRAAES